MECENVYVAATFLVSAFADQHYDKKMFTSAEEKRMCPTCVNMEPLQRNIILVMP